MVIEEKRTKAIPAKVSGHMIELEDRESLKVGGVENIDSFSDSTVVLDTNMGRLVIKGEGLHISRLDVSDGNFSLSGKVNSMEYLKKTGKKGNFFENLFR